MKNKYIRFLLGRISTYIHKSPNEFVLKVGRKLIFATSNLNIEQIHSRSSFELNKLVFQIYFLSFHYQTMKLIFIFAPLLLLQPSILIRSEYIFFRADYCCVCIHKLMSIQGPKNFKCPSLGSVPFLNRSNNSTNYFGIFMTFFTDVVLFADNSNNISWRMVFVKVIILFFHKIILFSESKRMVDT